MKIPSEIKIKWNFWWFLLCGIILNSILVNISVLFLENPYRIVVDMIVGFMLGLLLPNPWTGKKPTYTFKVPFLQRKRRLEEIQLELFHADNEDTERILELNQELETLAQKRW